MTKPLTLDQIAGLRRRRASTRDSFQVFGEDLWAVREQLLDAAERVARLEADAIAPEGYDTQEADRPDGFVLHRHEDGSSVATYFNARGEPVRNPDDAGPQSVSAPRFDVRDSEALAIDAAGRRLADDVRAAAEFAAEADELNKLLELARQRAAAVHRRAAERFAELQPEADREFGGRPWVPDNYERPLPPHVFQPKHVVAWFAARGLRLRCVVREGTLKERAQMLFDPIQCIGDDSGKVPIESVGLSLSVADKENS